MHRVPVTSTQLASVGWEQESTWAQVGEQVGTLEVEFARGQVYRYQAVPEQVYRDLLAESARVAALGEVPSVGRAFDRLVKQPGYAYTRVAVS